jgi:hypothetical protein
MPYKKLEIMDEVAIATTVVGLTITGVETVDFEEGDVDYDEDEPCEGVAVKLSDGRVLRFVSDDAVYMKIAEPVFMLNMKGPGADSYMAGIWDQLKNYGWTPSKSGLTAPDGKVTVSR